MTIVESNRLIASFMGAKFATHALKGTCWLPVHGVCNVETIELGKGKILEYHKSWDWLMPVVKKIKSLDDSIFNYHVSNMTQFKLQKEALLNIPITTDIGTVYSQIVDFINWYNYAK